MGAGGLLVREPAFHLAELPKGCWGALGAGGAAVPRGCLWWSCTAWELLMVLTLGSVGAG